MSQQVDPNQPFLYGASCLFGVIGLVVLVFGGIGTISAYLDKPDAPPQPVALATLLRDGPGANPWVELSGFRVANRYSSSSSRTILVLLPTEPRVPPGVLVVRFDSGMTREDIVAVTERQAIVGKYSASCPRINLITDILRDVDPALDRRNVACVEVSKRSPGESLSTAKQTALVGIGLFAGAGVLVILGLWREMESSSVPTGHRAGNARAESLAGSRRAR